jgi:anti-sigma B factor antagonist
MTIRTDKASGVTVVKLLESRLGAAEAARFKSAIAALIAQGYTELLLDLSTLQFMDSSGLGAMVSVFKMLTDRGNVTHADFDRQQTRPGVGGGRVGSCRSFAAWVPRA